MRGRAAEVAAATAGMSGSASAGSPGAEGAVGLTPSELYARYVAVNDRWRAERLRSRQQEIVMEELCSEVEKRAALVKEQQVPAARPPGCPILRPAASAGTMAPP